MQTFGDVKFTFGFFSYNLFKISIVIIQVMFCTSFASVRPSICKIFDLSVCSSLCLSVHLIMSFFGHPGNLNKSANGQRFYVWVFVFQILSNLRWLGIECSYAGCGIAIDILGVDCYAECRCAHIEPSQNVTHKLWGVKNTPVRAWLPIVLFLLKMI